MPSFFPAKAPGVGRAFALFGLCLFGPDRIARGEEPPRPSAAVECARASEPGRVRCEIVARVPLGTVLEWADVVVTKTPPFASALRGRVGPLEATSRDDNAWRWAIALVARGRGAGELGVRVRLVTCVKDACAPMDLDARADVVVGE